MQVFQGLALEAGRAEAVLELPQVRRWVDRLRVPESQIQRDHLVSVVLLSLSELLPNAVFFGGTALCRTHLPDWRLSEDVDLLVERVADSADVLGRELLWSLRREYPGATLEWVTSGNTRLGIVRFEELAIQLQLVGLDDSYRRYPTASTKVTLRYEDLPEAVRMRCPTVTAATAMKLNAWVDRAAPRDLCDLYGLTAADRLTRGAVALAGEIARPLQQHNFDTERLPPENAWMAALAHQMPEPPPRHTALEVVRSAVAQHRGWT